VNEINIPMQCRHCEDAPCETICPTGAISRENSESPVVVDEHKCIGCKMCMLVCLFGVLKRNKAVGVVTKCDLCTERLAKGVEPACVVACATDALQFTALDELSDQRKEEIAKELLAAFKKSEKVVKTS
jgi:carbon-monoxide dehydrogenase iron sulfur subunit